MARYDVAVVGAGILGLAHAWCLARRGLQVALFERHRRAHGASVRNFGMIWPIGQRPDTGRETALRSRHLWEQVAAEAGFWFRASGSLHVAYHDDEAATLREFVARYPYAGEWVEPEAARKLCPHLRMTGLRGGMYSPTEATVDPREAVARLVDHLSARYRVDAFFGTPVLGYESGRVATPSGTFAANRMIACIGDDLDGPFAAPFRADGLIVTKLQMLRSTPHPERTLGPMLAGGLTLRHYPVFADLPSLAAVRDRVQRENPEFDRWGIHVLVSQNGAGELILGDSHLYGDDITPFDDPAIDQAILDYLSTFLDWPDLRIAARWNGQYAKHPSEPWLIRAMTSDAVLVTGVGGAGMTLAFGLAERVTQHMLGEALD